jgi:hypothetical protein
MPGQPRVRFATLGFDVQRLRRKGPTLQTPNGVIHHSPGSRSAPWDHDADIGRTPTGFHSPSAVSDGFGAGTRGILWIRRGLLWDQLSRANGGRGQNSATPKRGSRLLDLDTQSCRVIATRSRRSSQSP